MSSNAPPPPDRLVSVIEAVLFSSGEPVRPEELAAVGGVEVDRVESAVGELSRRYERQGSGLRVERVAGGFQLATTSEVGAWVRRFFRERNRTRISPAALETLAIVAYRQPVTVPEIQAIRGKDPTSTLGTLLDKKLLRIMGKKKVVGRPLLYGTSRQFLMHFGLDSLEDLPAIEDFEQLAGALEQIALPEQADEPVADEAGDEQPAGEDAAAPERVEVREG